MQGESLQALVAHLERTGVLKSKNIKKAFLEIDRKNYIPHHLKEFAYKDHPLVLADDQTISQPTTVAFMLELLDIQSGNKILDIGAGSAWASCLMAFLTGETGRVLAYEINEVVGMLGLENVQHCGMENVRYMIGDAADYWENEMPYDRIHSGAAFREIPTALKHLLKPGGIMVVPTQNGYIKKITRIDEQEFVEEEFYGFTFVPFLEK
jgi:protein-L-isoaspartate(D-aspartate) O-methyltransferase